jgi:GTP pyrophosphokinase
MLVCYVTIRAKNKIRNVLRKYQKIAEDGKEILTRKLKYLKIALSEVLLMN